jgi:hypothetical protein
VIIPAGYTFEQDGRFYKVRTPIGSGTVTDILNTKIPCQNEGGTLPVPYPETSYQAVLRRYNAECSGFKIVFGMMAIDITNKIFLTDNGEVLRSYYRILFNYNCVPYT